MRVHSLVVAVIAALLLPTTASAQISTATLTGTIVDESKAVLPGATLVATDVETGRKYETRQRCARCVSVPVAAAGRLQDRGGARRILEDRGAADRAARRPERVAGPHDAKSPVSRKASR